MYQHQPLSINIYFVSFALIFIAFIIILARSSRSWLQAVYINSSRCVSWSASSVFRSIFFLSQTESSPFLIRCPMSLRKVLRADPLGSSSLKSRLLPQVHVSSRATVKLSIISAGRGGCWVFGRRNLRRERRRELELGGCSDHHLSSLWWFFCLVKPRCHHHPTRWSCLITSLSHDVLPPHFPQRPWIQSKFHQWDINL